MLWQQLFYLFNNFSLVTRSNGANSLPLIVRLVFARRKSLFSSVPASCCSARWTWKQTWKRTAFSTLLANVDVCQELPSGLLSDRLDRLTSSTHTISHNNHPFVYEIQFFSFFHQSQLSETNVKRKRRISGFGKMFWGEDEVMNFYLKPEYSSLKSEFSNAVASFPSVWKSFHLFCTLFELFEPSWGLLACLLNSV